MSQLFQIKLQGTADTKQWVEAQGVLKRLDSEAQQFISSLKAGVGIDLGGRLVSSLAQLPGIFTQTLQRGFNFNKTLGDTEVAISNVLQKFKGLDQAGGDIAAKGAIEKIIELEPKAAGTLQDLTQGFLASAASAAEAGLTVEQNIDLVGKFANGLANASIPAEQLSQEIRAAFSGNITQDAAFAKIIGLTNAAVRSAKEAGTLYELLDGKIGKLGQAGDTAQVALSSLESALDKAAGELAKPLFDAVIQGAKDLTEQLKDPVIQTQLREVGVEIGKVAKVGVDLTKWALANAPALFKVAEALVKVGAGIAGVKLFNLIAGLVRQAAMVAFNTTALGAETAALAQNTAAQSANAAARGSARGGVPLGLSRSVDEFGNATYASGGRAAERLAGGLKSRAAAILPGIMNNLGSIVAAGIAGWQIGKWIDEKFDISETLANDVGGKFRDALEKEAAQGGKVNYEAALSLSLASTAQEQEKIVTMMERDIANIEKQLQAKRASLPEAGSLKFKLGAGLPVTGGDGSFFGVGAQALPAIEAATSEIKILEARKKELENRVANADKLAGTAVERTGPDGKKVTMNQAAAQLKAAEAAEKHAKEVNAMKAAFAAAAAESGGLKGKLTELQETYRQLAETFQGSVVDIAGKPLVPLASGKADVPQLEATLDRAQSSDQLKTPEDVKRFGELIAVAKALGDTKKQIADEAKDQAEKERQLETDLLELKVGHLEAFGTKAEAVNARVLLETRQLAEKLFTTGEFKGTFDDALTKAAAQTKAAADIKAREDDQRVRDARETAEMEDAINVARAAGNEKLASELEEKRRIAQLTKEIAENEKRDMEEAGRLARERVANERAAAEASKEGSDALADALRQRAQEVKGEGRGTGKVTSDQAQARRDASRGRAQSARDGAYGGLAELDSWAGKKLRDEWSFPALDAFDARQTDPRRRAPISSVELPPGIMGPPKGARPEAARREAGGGPQHSWDQVREVTERAAAQASSQLGEITGSIRRLYAAMNESGRLTNDGLKQTLLALLESERGMRARVDELRGQIKSNRT